MQHGKLSAQTSFFLWKGLSSGQSGMTSAKLWRRDRGLGTDNSYKTDDTRKKMDDFDKETVYLYSRTSQLR
jgi:hypothetical protein